MIEIKNKQDFFDTVKTLSFRYAKTYTDKAPHEYAMQKKAQKSWK